MKKALAIAAALALLSACSAANVANKPVDLPTLQKSAYAARAAYVGYLEVAVNITDMPRCERSPPPCVTQPVVNKIRAVQKSAGDATSKAEKYARELTVDPTALSVAVQIANESVGVFKQTIDANKTGGK